MVDCTKIILPKVGKYHLYEYTNYPLLKVTNTSPVSIKHKILRLARYFRREFRYDFTQFCIEDSDQYEAYGFEDPGSHDEIVGGTCFRWREWKNSVPEWSMQWIWIHPYFRCNGILKKIWPTFVKYYGNFFVEPPLSKAMIGFLLKYDPEEKHCPGLRKFVNEL